MCFGTSIIVKNDQFGKLVSTGNFLSNFSSCLKRVTLKRKGNTWMAHLCMKVGVLSVIQSSELLQNPGTRPWFGSN